jgi:hypothetical protein
MLDEADAKGRKGRLVYGHGYQKYLFFQAGIAAVNGI